MNVQFIKIFFTSQFRYPCQTHREREREKERERERERKSRVKVIFSKLILAASRTSMYEKTGVSLVLHVWKLLSDGDIVSSKIF